MDLGFHTRRAMAAAAAAAPATALDYDAMVASLAADQAQGATSRAAGRLAVPRGSVLRRDAALAAVFLGSAGWVDAAALLGGAFDTGVAATFRHRS